MSMALWTVAGIVIVGGMGLLAIPWLNKPRSVPDKVEKLGCLEVVTQTYFYRRGWNTGKLGWGRDERYSIRSGGRNFTLPGKDGSRTSSFNAVFLFPTPAPALVINAGDPNNTSQYYLLRCDGERAAVEPLGDSRSGNVSAVWIDPDPNAMAREVNNFSRLQRLGGGRLLLLGGTIIMDTQTLQRYPVPTPKNWEFHVNDFAAPLSISPDRQSFARFSYTRSPETHPTMGVFNFVTGEAYHLPLDLRRMRFNLWEDIDRAWFDHHFEWVRVSGKPDRLIARPSFVPLSYRGHKSVDQSGYREYTIMFVAPEMMEVIATLLQTEYGARPLPGEQPTRRKLQIGERVVNLSSRHEQSDAYVALYMDRGPDSSFVFELGERIDKELATGKYDHLFHQDASTP